MIKQFSSNLWSNVGDVWARGYAFSPQGNLLSGEDLAAYFLHTDSSSEFREKLISLNGLFSVVIDNHIFKAAAVDFSRNFPLYFRLEKELILSDDPSSLRMPGDRLSAKALAQYDSAGAVGEGMTLIDGIFQLKAGHFICFNENLSIQHRFYTLSVKKDEVVNHTFPDFLEVLEHITDRLIQSVKGRQMVVPLSGGFDSRLIACMLHNAKYKDVVCYTIGSKESQEVDIARCVAEKLGFPFIQIDTTNAQLAPPELIGSEDFEKYYRFLGGYSNFLWLYEYFAVRFLKLNSLIAEDAVFVPGHSGDSFAGSHLIKGQLEEYASAESMADTLLRYSNEYAYRADLKKEVQSWFERELAENVLPYSAYQSYIFQNRQAHQIVNAARAYSHFDYELRLPLFDLELLDFMKTLPFCQLRRKSFYNNAVMNEVFAPLGVDYGDVEAIADEAVKKQMLKKRLKRWIPTHILSLFTKKKGTDGEYELMQPMLAELVANGVYGSKRDCLSVNKTIRDWYLMKVKQELEVG